MVYKSSALLFSLVWLLLNVASIFTATDLFVEPLLAPKWYAFNAFFIIGGLFVVALKLFCSLSFSYSHVYTHLVRITNLCAFLVALLSLLQHFGFTSSLYGSVHGTFDNAAGLASCLVLAFPLGLSSFHRYYKHEKVLFALSKVVSIATLIISGSRVGVICILAIFLFFLLQKCRYRLFLFFISMSIMFIVSVLFFKTDSSKGRWFIAQRSIEMITAKPFTGWGQHGFLSNYMNVQADYFSMHPGSCYAILADNVHHPLNEFLLIAVNYGIVPSILVCIMIVSLVVLSLKQASKPSVEGYLILMCIVLLCAFSYPLSYPFTSLMLFSSLLLICTPFCLQLASKVNLRILLYPVFIFLLCMLVPLANNISDQLIWKKAMNEISNGNNKKGLAMYSSLYSSMKKDCAFLYNYGMVMYQTGKYRNALLLAKEAEKLVSDYDLQLLLGDSYSALGQREEAISAYYKASYMCPSRLIPLYEMYMLYSRHNDTINCGRMYDIITHRRYKRMNTDVLSMLHQINKDYKRFIQININN